MILIKPAYLPVRAMQVLESKEMSPQTFSTGLGFSFKSHGMTDTIVGSTQIARLERGGCGRARMAGKGPGTSGSGRFSTTDWQLIAAARGADVPQARNGPGHLCAAYWYPLYAYLRRRGHSADQAQDLTQGFFASLLGRDFLAGIAPEKGKFRSFLLSSLQNYLSNERRSRAGPQTRGRARPRSRSTCPTPKAAMPPSRRTR